MSRLLVANSIVTTVRTMACEPYWDRFIQVYLFKRERSQLSISMILVRTVLQDTTHHRAGILRLCSSQHPGHLREPLLGTPR